MRRFLTIAVATASFLNIAMPDEPFTLHDGTPIRLRLNRNLSSADATVGETVDFEVLEDVRVGDVVVIARGGVALATVTEAQSKRRMGKGGKLNVNIDHVRLVSNDKVALRAVKETKGGGSSGAMTGGIVATSIIFFPAAPLFLFMHGKDITIPKGTEITAYVQGDAVLDRSKFVKAASAAAPAPAAAAPAAAKTLTNADVVTMKEAGLSEDVIVTKVKSSPGTYALDVNDLIALKKAGVSERVIQAMLEVQKSR